MYKYKWVACLPSPVMVGYCCSFNINPYQSYLQCPSPWECYQCRVRWHDEQTIGLRTFDDPCKGVDVIGEKWTWPANFVIWIGLIYDHENEWKHVMGLVIGIQIIASFMWKLMFSCFREPSNLHVTSPWCLNKWVNIHLIPELVWDDLTTQSGVIRMFEYSWRAKAGFPAYVPSNKEI